MTVEICSTIRQPVGGKRRWDLLPWAEVELVVRAIEYGAKHSTEGDQRAENCWQLVSEPRKYFVQKVFRHLVKRVLGEELDAQSGLPHLAHAAANTLMLLWHDNQEVRARDTEPPSQAPGGT